jgi:hypothetical protein
MIYESSDRAVRRRKQKAEKQYRVLALLRMI